MVSCKFILNFALLLALAASQDQPAAQDPPVDQPVAQDPPVATAQEPAVATVQDPAVDTTDSEAVAAYNAQESANSAKAAAAVANKVAEHSIHLTHHAQEALHHAKEALQHARVDSEGLSTDQKMALKKAESKLDAATQKAEYGELKQGRYLDGQLGKAQDKLDANQQTISEAQAMRNQLEVLRSKLKSRQTDIADSKAMEQEIDELERLINEMEDAEKSGNVSGKSRDELKVEIGRLEDEINKLSGGEPGSGELHYAIPDAKPSLPIREVNKVADGQPPMAAAAPVVEGSAPEATVVESAAAGPAGAIDTDLEMPYGDLEPFGREDTAQELTEASIKESDGMVDQLERAEVAEEKRAVFRALTRLRGAAITSFDGIARSQTGNIDEYNKVNKWRNEHPLHHLAAEEADVSKWAFPDNADFIQMKNRPAKPL